MPVEHSFLSASPLHPKENDALPEQMLPRSSVGVLIAVGVFPAIHRCSFDCTSFLNSKRKTKGTTAFQRQPPVFCLFAVGSETNLTSFHPATAVHNLPDTASMHSGHVHPEPDPHYRSLHSRMPVHPVLPYQRLPCSEEQRL